MVFDNILFKKRIRNLYAEAKKLSSKSEYEGFMNSISVMDREQVITYAIYKHKNNVKIGVPDDECKLFYKYIVKTDNGQKALNDFLFGSLLPIALTLLIMFLYLIIRFI